MANYQTISEKDVARGIDARSTEDQIPEGYSEDLLNVDTNSNGYLSKRPGYQGYYGYLPIRITEIEHNGTSIIFTLDGSFDTSALGGDPLVVYGKLGAPTLGSPAGDWSTTNTANYYSTFTSDIVKTLTAPSGTLTVTENQHGHDTPNLFTQLVTSDGTDKDNSYIYADATQIDVSATTYDVDFDYSGLAANQDVFALIADKSTVTGDTYNETQNLATGTHTNAFSIAASTHNPLVSRF